MSFPNADRISYKQNTLNNVVCQIRFPTILRIDSEIPSKFQECIRERFPEYNLKVEISREEIANAGPQPQNNLLTQISNISEIKNHEFISEDSCWKLNLTRNFLSISTTNYTSWEEFVNLFFDTVKALIRIYKPPFYTRIGLRYVNIFDKGLLGLENEPWEGLLKSTVLGFLSSEMNGSLRNQALVAELDLNLKGGTLRIACETVVNTKTNEQCFKIDSDFFIQSRTPLETLAEQLDELHDNATNEIQWIIQPTLHTALQPLDQNTLEA